MDYTLITGASKGIGKAFAYECAGRGMNLILTARSTNLLESIAADLSKRNISVQILAADLLDHSIHKKIFTWIEEHGWNVNMLINNAGMGFFGKFDDKPLEKHLDVMHLNMDAMVRMAYSFLHYSSAGPRRYILNTVSTGAFQPTPYMSVYSASKSFMLSFSQAIRYELRKQNVYVTALCPGGTESEFFIPAGLEKVVKKNERFMMSADRVAKCGIEAVLKNKSVSIPGITNQLGAMASGLIPHNIVVPAAASFFKV